MTMVRETASNAEFLALQIDKTTCIGRMQTKMKNNCPVHLKKNAWLDRPHIYSVSVCCEGQA